MISLCRGFCHGPAGDLAWHGLDIGFGLVVRSDSQDRMQVLLYLFVDTSFPAFASASQGV